MITRFHFICVNIPTIRMLQHLKNMEKRHMRITIPVLTALMMFAMLAVPIASKADPNDVPADHWAYSAVEYLYEEGLAEGFPDGGFHGDRNMTRYEFAMVIARMYNKFMDMMEDQSSPPPPIDVESVLDRLMDEFEPELDDLRALIVDNIGRIEDLEDQTSGYEDMFADINDVIDGMNARFKPFADLRVRFEGKYPETGLQRQRARYRLRWGFNSRITDELSLGTRFATGSDGAITSTNRSIEDAFGMDSLSVDRAYLKYMPDSAPGFTMYAGKFGPPWQTTVISMDSDTNVEGLAQSYNHDNFNFYLGELVPASQGFYLVAQVGYDDLFVEGLDAAVTYHFINEDAWGLIMDDMQNGDLVSRFIFDNLESPTDYRAVEGYLSYSDTAWDTPWRIELSCLTNLEDTAPGYGSALNQAGWARLSFGNISEQGDWDAWVEWGKIQANSALSWLTDSDRGEGDHEWFGGSWSYRLLRNTDLTLTFISADRLSRDDAGFDLVQVDVATKI